MTPWACVLYTSGTLEGVFSYPLFHFDTVGQGVSAAVVDGDIAGWKKKQKQRGSITSFV